MIFKNKKYIMLMIRIRLCLQTIVSMIVTLIQCPEEKNVNDTEKNRRDAESS